MFNVNLNKKVIISLMPSLTAGMLGALVIQFGFHMQQQSSVSTINITGMVSSFIKETAKQNLSLEEKEKKVSQFTSKMQKVLDETASRRNTIIMPSEAVIAGSIDLTEEVATKIKKEFK